MIRFLTIVLCLTSAFLVKANSLSIYTEQFPPYNYLHDNKIVGINLDIIKRACDIADVDCTFKLYPWLRAYKAALHYENSGVMSTSRSEEREQLFQWIGPLVYSKNYFYKLASRDDIQVDTAEDLLKYTVSAQIGDIYQDVLLDLGFENDKNLLQVSSKYRGVKLFYEGKLDLLIATDKTIEHKLGKYGYDSSELVPVFPLTFPKSKGNYLALNKSVPKSVVEKLQKAVDQLRETGEFETISNQYKFVKPN